MDTNINPFDSIENIDLKLRSRYRVGLFDFAYLMAIALNNDFLPKNYFGLSYKSIDQIQQILLSTKTKLSEFLFLASVIREIDSSLKSISEITYKIARYPGRPLSEKSKLILLWTSLLMNKHSQKINEPYIDKISDMFITRRIIENINWVDYAILYRWFAKKLSKCSYHKYLEPKPNSKKDIIFSKSEKEKNYMKTRGEVESNINAYIIAQGYFDRSSINYGIVPIRVGRKIKPSKSSFKWETPMKYPISYIGFAKNYIEIGERREDCIVLNRTTFSENQKIYSKKECPSSASVSAPSILFPHISEHKFDNYSCPYCPTDEIIAEAFQINRNI